MAFIECRTLLEDDWRMEMRVRRYLATSIVGTIILGLATLSPAQNAGVEKTSGMGLCAKCMLHMTFSVRTPSWSIPTVGARFIS